MPSLWSVARALASSSNYTSWQLTVSHPGLGLTRTFRGRDKLLVEQRAHAQMVRWDLQWERRQVAEMKRAAVEQRRQEKEEALQEAKDRTDAAQAAMSEWKGILVKGLGDAQPPSWEVEAPPFDEPQPKPTALPPEPRPPAILGLPAQAERRKQLSEAQWMAQVGVQPKEGDTDYSAPRGLGSLFKTAAHKQRVAQGLAKFKADHAAWVSKRDRWQATVDGQVKAEVERARKQHDERLRFWREQVSKVTAANDVALQAWKRRRQDWEAEWRKETETLRRLKMAYAKAETEGVEKFVELAAAGLEFPDFVPGDIDSEYAQTTRSLVLDFALPSPDDVPTVREVRYVHSRQEFDELLLTQRVRNEVYDSAVYQIVLRTLHDLFLVDDANSLAAITLNGVVESTSKATGKTTTTCILSIQVTREQMEAIDLRHIDPKACFKSLKGVGSSQLAGLGPVPPIVTFNKTDRRFVPAQSVAAAMASGPNIATMDWEDFEHLVRELFEKEFSHKGAEVKITRASRDAGVDAVVFDPDPLRGGKIIIQAKRYTNTAELSAVRDLYGTVVNEGAIKGILVTTSDYGPDAYTFAKDKPLTLLTGGNLLHLLRKHGYLARLDLREARALLREGAATAGRFRP